MWKTSAAESKQKLRLPCVRLPPVVPLAGQWMSEMLMTKSRRELQRPSWTRKNATGRVAVAVVAAAGQKPWWKRLR